MNNTKPTISSVKIEGYTFPEEPDYMPLVDEDIRAIFTGKGGYMPTDILLAQAIKELRKLNASKENLK